MIVFRLESLKPLNSVQEKTLLDSKLIMRTECFNFVRVTDDNDTWYEILLTPTAWVRHSEHLDEFQELIDPHNTHVMKDKKSWQFHNYELAERKLQWAILHWS